MAKERIIETVDEHGHNISFKLLDIIPFENKEYALVQNPKVEDNDDSIVLMRLITEQDGGYSFETIDDDDEFERVSEYVDEVITAIDEDEE